MSTAPELGLARAARRERRLQDAERHAEAALAQAEGASAGKDAAQALAFLGQLRRDEGDLDAALAFYLRAEDRARGEGDPLLLAHTVRHIGDVHWDMGDADLAEPCFEEALTLYRDNDPAPGDLANALRPMAILKQAAGDKAGAYELWVEAGDLYRAAGIEAGVAECTARAAALSAGP